ncbi:NAD(P)H-hydrate epimerase [Bordetella sp. BOR01]|uniref:NAD(P)H-hydrate epimerase n=1 Tax=Bordetella sp. BOR01 TaxID=2854779 RepID=UPI001C46E3B0|nr:NAD(P)H-hydrate epimerase [Bordetella sp. BOR01]MBV7482267.1 NAD(P)H-hydrate epimerase [Bordetella sp. BOR01]
MPAYSVAQIRRAEQQALALGRALMPLAGAAAADFIAARFPAGSAVLALVGPGNNGGDALVASAQLLAAGYAVRAVMPRGPQGLPADAARAYAAWRAQGGMEQTTLVADPPPEVIIDGLFGIGLNRPLGPAWQALVDAVNTWGKPVLALDVPSGVEADSGRVLGRALRARWTLSFIGTARGLHMPGAGREAAGELHANTLGVAIAPS